MKAFRDGVLWIAFYGAIVGATLYGVVQVKSFAEYMGTLQFKAAQYDVMTAPKPVQCPKPYAKIGTCASCHAKQ